jgi:hypothetical protein
MRRLLGLLVFVLACAQARATTYNVNNSMSESTIQGTVNTACGSSGNTVVFAAGNYTGWTSQMTVPGGHGCILTGPVVGWTPAGIIPTAVINSDGALVGGFIFDVQSCTTGSAGAAATFEYLAMDGTNSAPGTGGITADDGCNSVKVFYDSFTGNSPNFGSENYNGAASI